jgi:predicted phage terminase large subunit-like protein
MIKQTTEADTKNVQVYIEREPGSGGKESAEATIRNLVGYHVEEDLPTGDKVVRADPFSVQVNGGNVMMMRGRWNHDYLDELEHFPFSTYKDQVDASSGAFSRLVKKKRKARTL